MANKGISPHSFPNFNETTESEDKQRLRFQVELEFVQCLANPNYLNFLAQRGYLKDQAFINYLKYLLYWKEPEYARYLKLVCKRELCCFIAALEKSSNLVTMAPARSRKKIQKKKDDDSDDQSGSDLDLDKPLYILSHYLKDRPNMLTQAFKVVGAQKTQSMLPPALKSLTPEELKSACLDELLGMSERRIQQVLNGTNTADVSSSDETSDEESKPQIEEGNTGNSCNGENQDKEGKSSTVVDAKAEDDGNVSSDGDTLQIGITSKEMDEVLEKPVSIPETQGKNLLEILELEMRARAIRALLKQNNSAASKGGDETEPEAEPDVDIVAELDSGAEAKSEVDSKSKTNAKLEAGSKSGSKKRTHSAVKAGSKEVFKSEADTKTSTDSKAEAASEADSKAKTDSKARTTNSKGKMDSKAEAVLETDTNAETDSDSRTISKAETVSEVDSKEKTITDKKSQEIAFESHVAKEEISSPPSAKKRRQKCSGQSDDEDVVFVSETAAPGKRKKVSKSEKATKEKVADTNLTPVYNAATDILEFKHLPSKPAGKASVVVVKPIKPIRGSKKFKVVKLPGKSTESPRKVKRKIESVDEHVEIIDLKNSASVDSENKTADS